MPQVGGLLGAIGGGASPCWPCRTSRTPVATSTRDSSARRPDRLLSARRPRRDRRGRARSRRSPGGSGPASSSAADRTAAPLSGWPRRCSSSGSPVGSLAAGPVPRFAETAGTSTAVRIRCPTYPPPTEVGGRVRRPARCVRAAGRVRRVRAIAGAGGGPPGDRPPGRSPPGPRPARSRSRPATCGSSVGTGSRRRRAMS